MKKNHPASPVSRSVLDKYRLEISRCVKCGSCRSTCPSFLLNRDETFSARGRMALIKAVLDGRLTLSDTVKDRLETCLTCMACEESCASGVPVSIIIQAAKEQAREESGAGIISAVISGVVKHPALFRAAAWLAPIALHYSKGRDGERVRSPECGVRSEKEKGEGLKGKIAFFPGCAIEYVQPEIGKSTIAVLNRLGYDVIIPEGLKCCGRPLLSLGDRKAAEEIAAQNASVLAGVDADAIVTACASCGLTFKREYPKLLPPDVKKPVVFDIHEFFAARLGQIRFTPVKRKITWHEPCHLKRGQGISGTVRDIILAIPGLALVKMKNADRCCGFGGVMRITHQAVSDLIADEKVRSIISTKAPTVVTGCPSCRMQIMDGLRRAGSDVEVLHTVQVIEEAISNGMLDQK